MNLNLLQDNGVELPFFGGIMVRTRREDGPMLCQLSPARIQFIRYTSDPSSLE